MRKTAHECVVLESMEGNYSLFSFLSVTELSHCEKKILQILIAVFTITEEKSGNKTVRMWVAWGGFKRAKIPKWCTKKQL